MQLLGKIALITGAKGGLGTFVTQAFLDAGALVYGASRSIHAEDFGHAGFRAVPAELTDRAAAEKLAQTPPRIDVAVHLVGAFAGGARIEESPAGELDKMLDLNLRSAFFFAQAVLPRLRESRGRFLAVASRSALEPGERSAAYSLSKAALVSLVRTMAAENRGVSTANVVLPGTMDTPANRAAMPETDYSTWVDPRQVASMLLYLASDQASHITGAAIPIYGAA
ncbi:MAG: SDR family oxidoreductase [Bryobacteraceae bacterium]|nr:SDR family oxidoreductase [Bryobacteraceae bacterium]